MKYYPPTLHTQHHAMKHLPPQHATNSQNSPIFIMQGRTFFHNTHHAPTTHPHRGDISFNQQARNIANQQEPTEKNCLRHHHDSGATPPRKVARNSIGRSFNKVRKRCNSNDLNSMFERVAGELRAKLGVDSAMRQARCGRDTCAVAGPGRASRQRTRPHPAAQTPPVWRAPEGPAAVPVGGGGAWPGFEPTRRAKLAARTASGRAGRPRGGRRSVGGTSDNSRNYSPARRSTSCMTRPHTALTHATAATPRTRERQGRICRKSSKP